ncbi:ATP-dependent DNA helicase, partial [Frankliniella fusca]
MNPRALRYNFCIVIKFCQPSSASALWEHFKDHLSEDFAPRGTNPTEVRHTVALYHIARLMVELDMMYSKTDLPLVNEEQYADYIAANVCADEVFFNAEQLLQDVQKLRPQQNFVFDKIVTQIQNAGEIDSNLFMLLGAGGVGKTFLFNTIIKYCKVNKIPFGACAYTGIAATLLLEGKTSHKLLGIPIKQTDGLQYLSSISSQSDSAARLKEMKVIIWDEISMVHKWQLELVDLSLKKLTGIDKPFANKLTILSGRNTTVESCITSSKLWEHFKIFEMTHNISAEEDPGFAAWLLKVGDGTANHPGTSRVDLEPDMYVENLDILIQKTFPEGPENATGDEVILTPLNRDMRYLNDKVAELLPGQSKTYLSYNKFHPDDTWDGVNVPITQDVLESTEAANLPPHRLNLKTGSIIMLLCNLDVQRGLCNGSRFKVLECLQNSIKCQRLHGPRELIEEP